MKRETASRRNRQTGMTLIEAAVAILVLTIGVTAVAAVFVSGVRFMGHSQDALLARVKAQEAIESVYAGRDDQSLQWADILNVNGATGSDGGKFLDAALPINDPGLDGLVNTKDDGGPEYVVEPGPDGVYGTADDVKVPITKFRRQIVIRDAGIPNVSLRTLTVIITDASTGAVVYKISTYISPYS